MRNADEKAVAVLRGSRRPDAEQEKRFAEFLLRTYGREIPLTFEEDKMLNGFTLTVGTDVYDWSLKSRLRQFEEKLKALKSGSDSVIPLMKEAVEDFTPSAEAEETGTVLTVGDEIAVVSGLEHAAYGEILLFSSGVKGMVQDLRRNEIGCVLFGDDAEITEGSLVRRSGKTAGRRRLPRPCCRCTRHADRRQGRHQRRGLPPHRVPRTGHHRPPAGQRAYGNRPSRHRFHVPDWPRSA